MAFFVLLLHSCASVLIQDALIAVIASMLRTFPQQIYVSVN